MRIRKHSRIVALALALVMILPLISIPTFAEDAVETPAYSFSENFDSAANVADVTSGRPAQTTLENGALRVENTAYDDGKYYAKKTQDDKTEITVTSVKEGTLTGTVTLGDVLYNITGPVNTTKTKTAATLTKAEDESAYTGDPVYICDGRLQDAWRGNGHVGTPLKLKTPAVSPTDYTKLYISADYYVSEDATDMGHEITWTTPGGTKNQRLDIALLTITSGDYVQFDAHGNQDEIRAGANTIRAPKGTWINMLVTLDLTNGEAMLQVNGDYVRTIYDSDLTSGLNANAFCVLQPSRGKTPDDPTTMKGYVLVDNVSVSSVAPDVLYSNDFDQYAGMALSDIRGGVYASNFASTLPSKLEVVNEEANTYFKFNVGPDIQPGSDLDTPLFAYTGYSQWGKNAALKAAGASAYDTVTGKLTVGGIEYTVAPANEAQIAQGFYGTFVDPADGKTYNLTTGLYAADTMTFDSNVDKGITMNVPPISYKDHDVVYYSADYYIEPGSYGYVMVQFAKVEGSERNMIGSIDLETGRTDIGFYFPIGRWANLTVKIDMATGAVTYYLNGVNRATRTGTSGLAAWGANIDLSRSENEPYTSARLHVLKTGKKVGTKGSISVDNVRFATTMPTLEYLAYEDFEGFANGAAPTTAFSSIANANTTVSDEKGSKAWKVDFKNVTTTGGGDADDLNINKNPFIFMAGTDYLKTPSIVYEADYYIEPTSVGQLEVQLYNAKFDGVANAWNSLYTLYFRNKNSNALLKSGLSSAGELAIPRGEWFTVSTVIDMVNGVVSVYLNNSFAFSYTTAAKWGAARAKNISLDDNKIIMGKVNDASLNDAGTFYMDNIKVFAGSVTSNKPGDTLVSQDFEGFTLGTEPTAAFNGIGASGSTVSDARGSKAWTFDFVNKGKGEVEAGDVNVNINPYVKMPGASYAHYSSVVLEADYFIEEGTTGVFQSQIYRLNYNSGAGIMTWCDLYAIDFDDASSSARLQVEQSTAYGSALMAVGRWNTVSCVIDLKTGDVDLYLNGNFAFGYNLATRYPQIPDDATNFSFGYDQWILAKINKFLGEGTLYVDNIEAYAGTAPKDAATTDTFTYEEFDYVTDGSSAVRAAFPGVPSLLTFKKEANGNVALRLDMGVSTSSDEVWIVRSDSSDCWKTFTREDGLPGDEGPYNAIIFSPDDGKFYNGEGELKDTHKYVYEDEYVIYDDDVTREDGDDDDYVGEYIVMTDAHDDSKTYKFWFLPGDLAEAVYSGGNVGATNACVYNAKTLSHSDDKTAILETDLFIEENSTGIVESQFTGYTYDKDGVETGGGWLQIFHLYLDERTEVYGNHFKAGQLNGQGGTNYGVCAKIGEWNNVKVLVDLETGVFKVYLNGVLARVYDCGHDNITITAPWSVVKVQRSNSPTTPIYKGGVLIDNVRVSTENVPTSTFEKAPDWFLSEEAFNLFTADLITQVDGASIRLSDPTGLRFASIVNTDTLDYLTKAFSGKKVSQGTLIAPANYVTAAGEASRAALDALKETYRLTHAYVDVEFQGSYFSGDASLNVGDNKCMAGSIVKILDANITREFTGFGYIEIEGVASFYATTAEGGNVAKSVKDVAIAARDAHNQAFEADEVGLYDADELAIIDTYADFVGAN